MYDCPFSMVMRLRSAAFSGHWVASLQETRQGHNLLFIFNFFLKVKREHLESHLDAAARRHLDLACVKLNANQEEFKETTRKLESKIEALERKLDSQKRLTANPDTKLDKEVLKLKEESPPFMWKIEYFSEILRDAKRGRNTEIKSGYFFTGPNGYKLMLCMNPNGNGPGKNTHISVYLFILRGKYDAVLPWPFEKTVTFTLIDQQENEWHRESYVQTLSCDDDSDTFARPVTDSSPGYGFPTFISHEELRRRPYIVDDTIFLQVQTRPLAYSRERCNFGFLF